MEIKLWKNFSKRRNSTKRPNDSQATTFIIDLKENTSVENPIFVIESNEFDWNYVKALGHYYFVDDIVILDRYHIQLSCSQDVLATYRSDIINSVQLIAYSSNNYNENVYDSRCTALPTFHVNGDSKEFKKSTLDFFDAGGVYLLTVLNNQSLTAPGITTYIMTHSDLITVFSTFFNKNWTGLFTTVTDPMKYVVSVKWMPIYPLQLPTVDNADHRIVFGKEEIGSASLVAKVLKTGTIKIDELSLDIDWYHRDFRKLEPYTKMQLFLPLYGSINLDNSQFYNEDAIHVQLYIEPFSGDVTAHVYSEAWNEKTLISYNIAYDIPVVQYNSNARTIMETGLGLTGSVAGIAASSTAAGAIAGIAGFIASAANAAIAFNSPTMSVKGNFDARTLSAYSLNCSVTIISYDTTSEPDDYALVVGRPVMEYAGLGSFVGEYIQCEGASIILSGRSGDRDAVNSFLNGGCYIE